MKRKTWWTESFFPMTNHQSTSAQAHNHAWKTVYDTVTSLKRNLKKDKNTIAIQEEHIKGFLSQQYIPPCARPSNREQLADALQNPPISKITSSRNPLVSMAVYQGEMMGKYVRNTEAKVRRCKKNEVVMREEIAETNKRKHELQTNVTNLSARNEQLEQTTAKAKHEMKQAQEKLKELKSEVTEFKTAYKPRNVKRREETKQRHISQLEERLNRKSEEVKKLKEELLTEKTLLQNEQKEIENKFEQQIESEKTLKVRAQKRASKWKRMECTAVHEENKMMQKLNDEVHYLQNENEQMKEKIKEILHGKEARTFQGGR